MSIYKKLAAVKKEVGAISKDSTNPFFKSKYFDINALVEHLEPLLEKNGLLLLQPLLNDKVVTQIIEIDTGEKVESVLDFQLKTDPQKVGSEITYFRRYTLASLLGLRAEDDDGNKASAKNEKQWMNVGDKHWNNAVAKKVPLSEVKKHYKIREENIATYEQAIK